MRCTRIWLPDIVPDSGAFTYVGMTFRETGARLIGEQILKVVELTNPDQVKRPYIKQLISKDLKFPLPHRTAKSKKLYSAKRPSTFA